jgi:hypothetical protein
MNATAQCPVADNIPAELRTQKRWCAYKLVKNEENNKFDKPPFSPVNGSAIGATEKYLSHFVTFEEALAGVKQHNLNGPSFVFLEGSGYVGIDFDDAIRDGVVHPAVKLWIDNWFRGAYVETSVSGTGVHIICKGELANALTQTALPDAEGVTVEMYSRSRHFATTGKALGAIVGDGLPNCSTSIRKLLQVLGADETKGGAASDKAKETKYGPMTVKCAVATYTTLLKRLREPQTEEEKRQPRHNRMHAATWFASRAFGSGVFGEKSEAEIKNEIREAAEAVGLPVDRIRNEAGQSWQQGLDSGKLQIIDAAAEIDQWIGGKRELNSEEVCRHFLMLDDLQAQDRRKSVYKKLQWKADFFDQKITELRQVHATEQQTDPATASIDEVRVVVDELVKSGSEADRSLAEQIIWGWIKTHAQVFYCGGRGYLLMNGGNGVPLLVSNKDDQDFNLLLISFGIHPGADMRHRVGKFIGTMCYHHGIQTETQLAYHYDSKIFTLYAALRRGFLLRIRKTRTSWDADSLASPMPIEEVPNGTDGKLFLFPMNFEPLLSKPLVEVTAIKELGQHFFHRTFHNKTLLATPRPSPGPSGDTTHLVCKGRALYPDDYLWWHLFRDATFQVKGFSQEQVQVLLIVAEMLLMMPGVTRERMLLECLGKSGSGKTFFAELLGLILIGPQFLCRPLQDDTLAYENQAINEHYIVYDNVSKISPKVADRICQSVTGFEVVRRELFTTAGEFRAKARATNAIAGINSVLTELEHKNRALTIHFNKRTKGNIVDVELRAAIARNRDDIILNFLRRAVWIVEALEAQKDYVPYVNVRLAGVGTFLLRVARHEGWEDEAKELLEAWESEQIGGALSGGDDDISTAMSSFLASDDLWKGKYLSPGTLNDELQFAVIGRPDDDDGPAVREMRQMRLKQLSWHGNTKALGRRIGANLRVYAERFGLHRVPSDFRNTRGGWMYKFDPTPEQLEGCRELAAGVLEVGEQTRMPVGGGVPSEKGDQTRMPVGGGTPVPSEEEQAKIKEQAARNLVVLQEWWAGVSAGTISSPPDINESMSDNDRWLHGQKLEMLRIANSKR